MLYDNAQLVNLYLDAYLVGGQPEHAETARDIIRYVLRDMTDRGRRVLFGGGRGQRRQGGEVLLLDEGGTFPIVDSRRIQRGGALFRRDRRTAILWTTAIPIRCRSKMC